MSLRLDFQDDYLIYDNPETVVLEVPRKDAGPDLIQIEGVIRLVITTGERMASGGVYTNSDVKWLLPSKLLPNDFAVFPGLMVIDSKAARWTILDENFEDLQRLWEVTSRNLALFFRLRDKIDVERATISYDAAGAAVKTFPPDGGSAVYNQIAARVQPQRQDVVDERAIRGTTVKYDVIVDPAGKPFAVTNEDRIKWTSGGVTRYLDIVGYRQAERIDELPVIEAESRP